jgi:hypothetical protein
VSLKCFGMRYVSTGLYGVTSQKTVVFSSKLLHGPQLPIGRAPYGPVLLTLEQKTKVTTGLRTSRSVYGRKLKFLVSLRTSSYFVTSGRFGSNLDPILTQAFTSVPYLHQNSGNGLQVGHSRCPSRFSSSSHITF